VPCQVGFWVWAAGDYANNSSAQFQPFNFGFAAARTQFAGFDCEINPGGVSDTGTYFKKGCVWDQSNSATSFLVTGSHTSAIDISGVTSLTQFANCAPAICSFNGEASMNATVLLTGSEVNPLTWQNGGSGQAWQFRENSSGQLYLYDLTNSKFAAQFLPNNGGIFLGGSGSPVTMGGTLGIPQATWTDTQTCAAGQISVDASFIYACTAANTVKRAALSSF
jgi:hypothetical protein